MPAAGGRFLKYLPISTLSERNVQCCRDVKGAPRVRAQAKLGLSLTSHGRVADKQRLKDTLLVHGLCEPPGGSLQGGSAAGC